MSYVGNVVFINLVLIFVIGIVVGLVNGDKGIVGLVGGVFYLVYIVMISGFFVLFFVKDVIFDIGVVGFIVIGGIVVFLYNWYWKIELL